MRSFLKLLILIVIVVVVGVIWLKFQSVPHSPPSPMPPTPGANVNHPTNPSNPNLFSDLVIQDVRANVMQGQVFAKITIKNNGSSTASGVHGVCSYRCASRGIQVSNQSFLQGGYLVPGKSVTGLLPITPCSDKAIRIRCIVDPQNRIQETNEINNRWEGPLPLH